MPSALGAEFRELRAEFDRCWPWLEGSLAAYGPTHSKEQIWQLICNSRAFFWPGETCASLLEVVNHPIGFKSLNLWLMGGSLDEIVHTVPDYEAWGRQQNCSRVMACGRRGWLKVLDGYKEFGTRRAKSLLE